MCFHEAPDVHGYLWYCVWFLRKRLLHALQHNLCSTCWPGVSGISMALLQTWDPLSAVLPPPEWSIRWCPQHLGTRLWPSRPQRQANAHPINHRYAWWYVTGTHINLNGILETHTTVSTIHLKIYRLIVLICRDLSSFTFTGRMWRGQQVVLALPHKEKLQNCSELQTAHGTETSWSSTLSSFWLLCLTD